MPSNRKIHSVWYVVSDYIAAILAWIVLYFVRRYLLGEILTLERRIYLNDRFWWGLSLIPLAWLIFYTLLGSYHSLYRKSRLNEFTITFIGSIIGCVFIFFMIVINDPQKLYTYYYKAFFIYLAAQFLFTWIGRWFILKLVKNQIDKGVIRFNALLVGGNSVAAKIFLDTRDGLQRAGYHYSGFLHDNLYTNGINKYLPNFGTITDLEKVLDEKNIRLVVIAMEKSDKVHVEKIVDILGE
jgi:FlaA1/EpsC-like NDP-sugar epimerase